MEAFPSVTDYAYDLSEAYARIHIPRPPIAADTQRTIEERFGKALALLEKLVAEHPEIPDFRAAEARLQDKLGSFYRQMERWSEAEQNFRKAIALQSPLVKQFPDVNYYGLRMATCPPSSVVILPRIAAPPETLVAGCRADFLHQARSLWNFLSYYVGWTRLQSHFPPFREVRPQIQSDLERYEHQQSQLGRAQCRHEEAAP